MTLYVPGVIFENKGAELMLRAVMQQFAGREDVAIGWRVGHPVTAFRLGLHRQLVVDPLGDRRDLARYVPRPVRRRALITTEAEITAVLDASGFGYGDQWWDKTVRNAAARARRWKDQGKKVVLLPQAFGPFTRESNRRGMTELVESADLVFARDPVSFEHVTTLGLSDAARNRVLQYPDFTNLLEGELHPDHQRHTGKVALVPNTRMLTHQSPAEAKKYVEAMVAATRHIAAAGGTIVGVLHETVHDRALLQRIQSESDCDFETVRVGNPLQLKGLLGVSTMVISARFHALVSALAQTVPCIAFGWSHKYRALMEDYGVGDYLIAGDDLAGRTTSAIDRLSGDQRAATLATLDAAAARQAALSREMWSQVEDLLHAG